MFSTDRHTVLSDEALMQLVERCYFDLITQPDETKRLIEQQIIFHQHVRPPYSAGLAALKFLHTCLTQVYFDVVCPCSDLGSPHCYYDHLYEWLLVVGKRRIIDQEAVVALSTESVPEFRRLEILSENVGGPSRDILMLSMISTLLPFALLVMAEFDPSDVGYLRGIRETTFRFIFRSVRPIYVRLSMELSGTVGSQKIKPGEKLPRCLIPPFLLPSNAESGHQQRIHGFDFRGSRLTAITLNYFQFINVDFRETVLEYCRIDHRNIGKDCQFGQTYVAPLMPGFALHPQIAPHLMIKKPLKRPTDYYSHFFSTTPVVKRPLMSPSWSGKKSRPEHCVLL